MRALGYIGAEWWWVDRMIDTCPAISDVVRRFPKSGELGCGGYKWVYASGDVAVGITNDGRQARMEISCLKRLQALGIPAVEVLEWVSAGKRVSGGALVMRRYRKVKTVTRKMLDQCREIASILREHKLYVCEPHIMLDEDGSVVVADPLYSKRFEDQTQEFKFPDAGNLSSNLSSLLGCGAVLENFNCVSFLEEA